MTHVRIVCTIHTPSALIVRINEPEQAPLLSVRCTSRLKNLQSIDPVVVVVAAAAAAAAAAAVGQRWFY